MAEVWGKVLCDISPFFVCRHMRALFRISLRENWTKTARENANAWVVWAQKKEAKN